MPSVTDLWRNSATLEFEAAMDKVDGADLAALKERYELAAVDVMGELEDEVSQYMDRIEADMGVLSSKKRGGR